MTEIRSICIVTSVHPDFDARVWRHATGLAARGIEVHLVCPWKVTAGDKLEGVHLHPFPRVSHRLPRPFLIPLRVLPKVFTLLRKVQLVHFHDIDILPYMAFLGLFKPVVYDVHENYPEEMLVRPYRNLPQFLRPVLYHLVRWGQWMLANVLRNVVLVVPDQKIDFWGSRLRIICIWNYASRDLASERALDYKRRSKVVAYTGSQYLENGSLQLLDIAVETRKLVPDVLFRVTDRFHGVAAFKQEFLKIHEELSLQDTVLLVPTLPANMIMNELNEARVGVIPALPVSKIFRSMPIKLFEYLAAGLPVVSFDLPHPSSVIKQAQCGQVIACGDNVAFARAIAQYLLDEEMAIRDGEQGGRNFSERYNWESQLNSLIEYYTHII